MTRKRRDGVTQGGPRVRPQGPFWLGRQRAGTKRPLGIIEKLGQSRTHRQVCERAHMLRSLMCSSPTSSHRFRLPFVFNAKTLKQIVFYFLNVVTPMKYGPTNDKGRTDCTFLNCHVYISVVHFLEGVSFFLLNVCLHLAVVMMLQ